MKVSKKQLDIFTSAVKKYQVELGLTNWDISVDQDELDETHWAETRGDAQAHYALILLNTLIATDYKLTAKDLKLTAYHECLEVMLYPLRIALSERLSWETVDSMVHDVIQRLINAKDIK